MGWHHGRLLRAHKLRNNMKCSKNKLLLIFFLSHNFLFLIEKASKRNSFLFSWSKLFVSSQSNDSLLPWKSFKVGICTKGKSKVILAVNREKIDFCLKVSVSRLWIAKRRTQWKGHISPLLERRDRQEWTNVTLLDT